MDVHRRARATLDVVDGWEVAVRYPSEPGGSTPRLANVVVDVSHRPVVEINGPNTGAILQSLCQQEPPTRAIRRIEHADVYRLTVTRAIVIGDVALAGTIDVTGGWASVALFGPDARAILSKVTALDLRDESLPVGTCSQGPLFGVNTLFGRFEKRYEIHACPDMLQFVWEVLLDAGREFDLRPAGTEWLGVES